MTESSVEQAISTIAAGHFALVVDHADRENEGDLVLAAEKVTPEKIAFMIRYTSGVICVPLEGKRLDELGLPLMVMENSDSHKTAFTISVDARHGTTTGISAADRSKTVAALVSPDTQSSDLARPGHVFPLRYQDGGVLVRPGHTEASIDLARLAGLYPAGVLCEIVNDDGTMTRGTQLTEFADKFDIPMIAIDDLIRYRWRRESLVTRQAVTVIPTDYGVFTAFGYRTLHDESEHVAFVMGDISGRSGVLTRIHSECLTGDVFKSHRCDCGGQLQAALRRVAEEGTGIVVYNRGHEGRGIGLIEKLQAYRLQEKGLDTVEANVTLGHLPDARHYGIEAQILNDLGAMSYRLMTNNPDKISQLKRFGITVESRIPIEVEPTNLNAKYLAAKASKLGHLIKTNGSKK